MPASRKRNVSDHDLEYGTDGSRVVASCSACQFPKRRGGSRGTGGRFDCGCEEDLANWKLWFPCLAVSRFLTLMEPVVKADGSGGIYTGSGWIHSDQGRFAEKIDIGTGGFEKTRRLHPSIPDQCHTGSYTVNN